MKTWYVYLTNFKWVIAYWSSHSHIASSVFQMITCEKQSTPSASEWAKRRLAMLWEFVRHFNSVSWGCCICLLLLIQPLPLGSLYPSVPSHCLPPCLTAPLTMLTFFRSQAPLSRPALNLLSPLLLCIADFLCAHGNNQWGTLETLSHALWRLSLHFCIKKKKKKKKIISSPTQQHKITISRIPPNPEMEFPGPRTFE